jgi:hypothetical protein
MQNFPLSHHKLRLPFSQTPRAAAAARQTALDLSAQLPMPPGVPALGDGPVRPSPGDALLPISLAPVCGRPPSGIQLQPKIKNVGC